MQQFSVTDNRLSIPTRSRFRIALILAMAADVVQFALLPAYALGGAFPADDVLDVGMGAALTYLLGWHWEFLPSFAAKLLPGVDLIPMWTLAVANVYRKSKQPPTEIEEIRADIPGQRDPRSS